MKLTGIIEDVFKGCSIFRGYATLKNLAIASKANSVLKTIENSGADYKGLGAGFEKMGHHRKLED